MLDPQTVQIAAGLFAIAAGYLAGRNRALARTLRTVNATYEALIKQLRMEIDRLHARVLDLEALSPMSTRSVRKVRPTEDL